jgi:hypothetical protein
MEHRLDMLIVAQLAKKFPVSCIIRRFITVHRVHKCPPLDLILSQMSVIHNLTPYYFEICFNIFSHLRLDFPYSLFF